MTDNKNFPLPEVTGLNPKNLEKLIKEGLLTDLTLDKDAVKAIEDKIKELNIKEPDQATQVLVEYDMITQPEVLAYVKKVLAQPTDSKEEVPGPDATTGEGDSVHPETMQPETTPGQNMEQAEMPKTKSAKSKK